MPIDTGEVPPDKSDFDVIVVGGVLEDLAALLQLTKRM